MSAQTSKEGWNHHEDQEVSLVETADVGIKYHHRRHYLQTLRMFIAGQGRDCNKMERSEIECERINTKPH